MDKTIYKAINIAKRKKIFHLNQVIFIILNKLNKHNNHIVNIHLWSLGNHYKKKRVHYSNFLNYYTFLILIFF